MSLLEHPFIPLVLVCEVEVDGADVLDANVPRREARREPAVLDASNVQVDLKRT